MISFDTPVMLYATPALGLALFLLGFWARRTRVRYARRWSRRFARTAVRYGRWGALAFGVAGVAVGIALAGPRFGRRVVTAETQALNLVVAVDISRSMLAEDVAPSRLGRVQQEARRLIQDLRGDRIGLIAFAGRSFILSPLTIDEGALQLLVDGLDPDMASTGGTELAAAINQGRELLLAGGGVADRVLVVFTDGEAHDTLPGVVEAAARLGRDNVHLVLVAEGRAEPVPIPVRDLDDVLIGYQRDPDDQVVRTVRRDDILTAVADGARGALVSARLGDQAGAVRDLVRAFKRSPEASTTAGHDVPRAWIPVLVAIATLALHTLTRRTAALAVLAGLLFAARPAGAQALRNRAEQAWQAGDLRRAAELYLEQVRAGVGGDTTWFNLGTAAVAIGDSATALRALARVAQSIDPELRFRALYNLGWLQLRLAEADSTNRDAHLQAARERYREALLLQPGHDDAKWNYELALRRLPPDGGGGQQAPSAGSGGASEEPEDTAQGGLTLAQAEQILDSMLEEERRTRADLNRRRKQARDRRGRKDW